jgi:hypothetical protein
LAYDVVKGAARIGSPVPSNADEDEDEDDLLLDEVGEDSELRDQIRFGPCLILASLLVLLLILSLLHVECNSALVSAFDSDQAERHGVYLRSGITKPTLKRVRPAPFPLFLEAAWPNLHVLIPFPVYFSL